MKFRPCIDIHNGKVKQIIGSSLMDDTNNANENFTSSYDAAYYANMYKKDGLKGGHIILLNPVNSEFYNKTLEQAQLALKNYPGGMQIGGGVNPENAPELIEMGASHVIVTSYAFNDGKINFDNLKRMTNAVSSKRIVLDLSAGKRNGKYYIATNRWQKFTDVEISLDVFDVLSKYCDEFLVHAVDVEGKISGVDNELLDILSKFDSLPVTYAGGIRNLNDIQTICQTGNGKIDFTVGSALDIFGGQLSYQQVALYK